MKEVMEFLEGSLCSGIILTVLLLVIARFGKFIYEPPEKKAGRHGERIATEVIKEVLNERDVLLTNVEILCNGRRAELDNVVINDRGVFIIEVKNFIGELFGEEDDAEWMKFKTSYSGEVFQKNVRNPIKQVKRQIYLLSQKLENHGVKLWIGGYVFLVEGNSPVKSDFILETRKDIERAIHQPTRNKMEGRTREKIIALLSK